MTARLTADDLADGLIHCEVRGRAHYQEWREDDGRLLSTEGAYTVMALRQVGTTVESRVVGFAYRVPHGRRAVWLARDNDGRLVVSVAIGALTRDTALWELTRKLRAGDVR